MLSGSRLVGWLGLVEMVGDLKLNMDLSMGELKCHRSVDLVLTPDGDLALTRTDSELMHQRLLLFLATPKGELLDPEQGSTFYEYLHRPVTGDNIASLRVNLEYDLKKWFPEFGVTRVSISVIGRNSIYVVVYMADDAIRFLYDPGEVVQMSNMISESLRPYEWVTTETSRGSI